MVKKIFKNYLRIAQLPPAIIQSLGSFIYQVIVFELIIYFNIYGENKKNMAGGAKVLAEEN